MTYMLKFIPVCELVDVNRFQLLIYIGQQPSIEVWIE